jgi:putative ABC transport system permease protein
MRFFFSRRRASLDAADELQSHVELLTERYVAGGLSPDQARAAAMRQLGNVTRVREDIYDMNGVRWIDNTTRDIRYAFRQMARTPLFALVVMITMALGIGANTAILSVAYAVLVKPLPYAQPDEIYAAQIVIPERRDQIPSLPATVQTFLAWQRAQTPFSSITAMTPWEASITGDGEPERLGGARVAANFFAFLGTPMTRGRGFADEESQPGKDRVVVISHGLWQRRYGAEDSAVGSMTTINGEPHRIIGVATQDLLVPVRTQLSQVLRFAPRVDIWKPIAPTPTELTRESWNYGVLVRLSDRARWAEGRQQLGELLGAIVRATGGKMEPIVELVPVRDIYSGTVRRPLLLVVAAALLLMLTACASIANVFLARGASRSPEIAMRLALGAGRGRIAAQLLTEALLLALAGGVIGAGLAAVGTALLAASGPPDVRALSSAAINLPFLACAFTVSVATGIICGVVPVLQANRRDHLKEIKDAGRGASVHVGRMRQALVGAEMAVATVLLASSALLLHSFVNVMNSDRGYDVENVLTADLSLFGERYQSAEARGAFYRELVDRVRALPGVSVAGAINILPALSATDGPSQAVLLPEDSDFQSVVLVRPVTMIRAVTAGYFAASGTTVRAGRPIGDTESQLVAIVSESLAARLWPGAAAADVVGRRIRQGGNMQAPLIEVIGVAADARPGGLERDPAPALYRPYPQWASGPMTLVVRTAEDPSRLAVAVRQEIRRLERDLPVASIKTMSEIVSSAVVQRRFQMTLTSLFAIVALLLGVVGVYGVTNYAVASRTKEIGVRLALGAGQTHVMRWAFAIGIRPVVLGLVSGLAAAAMIGHAFRAVLFGVRATDPLSFGAVGTVLLVAAGVACYLPARRAATVNPVVALRRD